MMLMAVATDALWAVCDVSATSAKSARFALLSLALYSRQVGIHIELWDPDPRSLNLVEVSMSRSWTVSLPRCSKSVQGY
jgi:hypothetical protein